MSFPFGIGNQEDQPLMHVLLMILGVALQGNPVHTFLPFEQ